MRIGLISDIHIDINSSGRGDVLVDILASESRKTGLDALLIAGDISNDYEKTLLAVDKLKADSGAEVLFVPGNHDIWNEKHPKLRARDTYDALLRHGSNLAAAPALLGGGWAVVGDLGWYDFAFGESEFTVDDFRRMEYGGRTWQDKLYSNWESEARDVHRMFMKKLGEKLDDVKGKNIVFVTHMVQIPEFTVLNPGPMWRYFNAFLGSPEYGELCLRSGVALSVCGHVHYRKTVAKGKTEFVCPCLGYTTEWRVPKDPVGEVAKSLAIYELRADGCVHLNAGLAPTY